MARRTKKSRYCEESLYQGTAKKKTLNKLTCTFTMGLTQRLPALSSDEVVLKNYQTFYFVLDLKLLAIKSKKYAYYFSGCLAFQIICFFFK